MGTAGSRCARVKLEPCRVAESRSHILTTSQESKHTDTEKAANESEETTNK